MHGGLKGFDTKVWNAKEIKTNDYAGLELTYTSVDGEEGYPGTLNVSVQYLLDKQNRWTMAYTAATDKPTVLNLTNHTFWNLAGFPKDKPSSNHEHILKINADRFLPTDDTLIPTGELKEVAGTPLDFRTPHKIGERIAQIESPHFAGGYDHCFILNQEKAGQTVLCAEVIEPNSGRTMTVHTTEPGVQFYSGNFLDGSTSAFGHKYGKHGALCLETQHYPNSPNNATFPNTVLRPGEKFTSITVHTFGITQ
jgi:aldose 1-epimerase